MNPFPLTKLYFSQSKNAEDNRNNIDELVEILKNSVMAANLKKNGVRKNRLPNQESPREIKKNRKIVKPHYMNALTG
ncbi:hypothetical protein AKJ61_01620 [candidate division MSBL1 archaeon SCGC-AAA259B11]|uniref:Uncharacterized protein n=1 Tax=candidate division MSBL1 archaeon SCGC-AAA259B11 TaxID=1698260 RepID=A0A133U775_9EURY|nr:hypothetical protein AKJ61_01620 [candidate division MSBL1 archaeon SCGC-AAA259B11]